ncbi:MAG TPA: cytochrome c biogenesis protein CcdA [Candidatus Brocadiia bacterium]|nr:cytochrome c biogenesis protein CcdA [Candidatus Brocadiia bacterium]
MPPRKLAFALATLAIAATLQFPSALAQLSSGPIEVTIVTPKGELAPGQAFEIAAHFNAGAGVHVYQEAVKFEWSVMEGAKQVGLDLPKPTTIPDILDPAKKVPVYEGSFVVKARLVVMPGAARARLAGKVTFEGCSGDVCYAPGAKPVDFAANIAGASPAAFVTSAAPLPPAPPLPQAEPSRTLVSWWRKLLLALFAGFAISITPCVLPMLPVTSSIILGVNKGRGWVNALGLTLLYILGLSLVYAVLGVLAGALGQRFTNAINSVYGRGFIALVFTGLALSMFDVIIIQTPAAINRAASSFAAASASRRSGLAGLAAVFGLGMVSGLVAGPCVAGPLAAILFDIATVGSWVYGFWMLFAVAWGMSPLLVLAGTAPGLLPKSGMWMVRVKHAFGFVLLWAGLYFLWPFVGDTVYLIGTAAVLVLGAVFTGALDNLAQDAGFGPRLWKSLGIAAVIGAALASWTALAPAPATAMAQPPAFPEAGAAEVRAALHSGQPVVLKFWASYCTICKAMEKEFNADQRVHEALKGVRALSVNIERHPEFSEEFGFAQVPAMRFFGADGGERMDLRSAGQNADELLGRIAALKAAEAKP